MTSLIAAGGSGRSTSVIPAVPAASSVTTIAFIRHLPASSSRLLADWIAGELRGGGAPAHSAQAQIDVLDLALAQLPVEVVSDLDTEIVMRIDSAGAAGALCQAAQDANIGFLVGFDLFTGVRESILQLPDDAWCPALRQDGTQRDGAQ